MRMEVRSRSDAAVFWIFRGVIFAIGAFFIAYPSYQLLFGKNLDEVRVVNYRFEAGFVGGGNCGEGYAYETRRRAIFENEKLNNVYVSWDDQRNGFSFCGNAPNGDVYRYFESVPLGDLQRADVFSIEGCRASLPAKCDSKDARFTLILKKNYPFIYLLYFFGVAAMVFALVVVRRA